MIIAMIDRSGVVLDLRKFDDRRNRIAGVSDLRRVDDAHGVRWVLGRAELTAEGLPLPVSLGPRG
jgi:hypothetical protein